MAKNKYRVNHSKLTDVDCGVLIEAAARYLNSDSYPNINVFAAILAIEKVEEEEE